MQASEIIDIVFIPIYFILFLLALYSFIKHGRGKPSFGLLFIFPLIRLVGNIVLVVAAEAVKKGNESYNTIQNLYIAGFVLQLAGFGILIGIALVTVNRATHYQEDERRAGGGLRGGLILYALSSPQRLIHLLNTVATILVIVGLTNSTSAFNPSANGGKGGSIDILAKVGIIMLDVVLVLVGLLALYHLVIVGPISPSARLMLTFVSASVVPMIARMAWSTYRVTSSDLLYANIWAALVLQYICECIALGILISLPFVLAARGDDQIPQQTRGNYAMEESKA